MAEIPYDYPTCQHCSGRGQVERVDGRSIRRSRETAGLSLRSVADRVGVSASYLSDMELGRRRMSKDLAAEILEICGRTR